MARREFGELNPHVVIQEDTRACFSASVLSVTDPELGLTEEDINQVLIEDRIYQQGGGTNNFTATELAPSLAKVGLKVTPVYDVRIKGVNERQHVLGRLAKIDETLRSGEVDAVLLAFPKRREGSDPFGHFAVVTGFQESPKGDGVVILDTSDVDGGIRHPNWGELREYVTPAHVDYGDGDQYDVPVAAWGISRGDVGVKYPSIQPSPIDVKGLPGFSLLAKPLYQEKDSGKPIPEAPHAISVVMPNADTTFQFAKAGAVSLSRDGKHPEGYPRFIVPGPVKDLSLITHNNFAYLPFPTQKAAEAAIHPERTYPALHIHDRQREQEILEKNGLFWLAKSEFNVDAWQHTGLGISSRQAEAHLLGYPENNIAIRDKAEAKIKAVITEQTGAPEEDIYLFPTGMAATYWLNQALIKASDGLPSVQFGFPYTDSYEQRMYGPNKNVGKNVLDFRSGSYEKLQDLAASDQQIRGLMTEVPSNPLLWTPDLARIDSILGEESPIVIDDTIGTNFNIDDSKLPPSVVARVTALTKFVASAGDVMGGSIVLRKESPHYEAVKEALDRLYEDTIWWEDALYLAERTKIYPNIMPTINQNAQNLSQWLVEELTGKNKPLEKVYHPSVTSRREYEAVMKEDGGYGGLMSLKFNSPKEAYKFFDALRVTKGPSLGTFYTLGCLYTWLAHKNHDVVKKYGVVPDFVRLSIGIEDEAELQERITEAMATL